MHPESLQEVNDLRNMLRANRKILVLLVLCALGLIGVWYFWPVNLTKEASKIAHAWINNDLDKIWSYTTEQEKQKLGLEKLKQAYDLVVNKKLGGVKQITPLEYDDTESPTSRIAKCNVESGDGTRMYLGFVVFKENGKVHTEALRYLIYLLERYYGAKEGLDKLDSMLKAYTVAKQEFEKIEINEVYHFFSNKWQSLDDMIQYCERIIALRDKPSQ